MKTFTTPSGGTFTSADTKPTTESPKPNLKHLIANMRKAAFNRQEVSIAGGIFEAAELKAGAAALEAFPELLAALQRIAAGEVMSGKFTHIETVHEYQRIAMRAIDNVLIVKKLPFEVVIPNSTQDGIAETVRIEVEATVDPKSGEEILTPESMELIEKTQERRLATTKDQQ